MRLATAWIVSLKDFSEFRANRQILLTLTALPVLMAVVIPLLLGVGLTVLPIPGEGDPPDLRLGNLTAVPAGDYAAQALVGVFLPGGSVTSGVINGSRVLNATLTGVFVEGSLLENVTLVSGVVSGSVLRNCTIGDRVALEDSYVGGGDPRAEELREVIGSVAVNMPLLFFVVLSVAVPTTLAAYSFVGEKANRSLEPLLAAPLTDGELLLGKYLSAFVPSMAVMLGSWVLFTVLADLLVLPRLGLPPLPDATWLVGILVLLPLLSFLGISVNVLISTKVSDVRVAQQYGALLVMPIVLFFSLSTGGAVFLGPEFLLAVAAVVGGLDVLVFLLTRVLFGREEILTKWK